MTKRDDSKGRIDSRLECQVTVTGALRVREFEDRWGDRSYEVHRFDVVRTDAEYWHQTRRFLIWLGASMGDWPRRAFKALRRSHNESKAREWDQVLPPEIVKWARARLDTAAKDCDYVDNYRVARVGNTSQVRRYRRQKDGGCCGFYDDVATGPDGHRYMLGFNHGH